MAKPALSRADLLRVLASNDPATNDRIAFLCGLQRPEPRTVMELVVDAIVATDAWVESTLSTEPAPQTATTRAPALRARHFQIWTTPLAPPETPVPNAAPMTLAELQAPADTPEPRKTPLLRRSQYWPALRSSLQSARPLGIDWPVLVQQLATDLKLEPLPQQKQALWAAPLWLIWDASERLMPYESDFEALFRTLKRLRGTAELRLYTLRGDCRWIAWRGQHNEQGEYLSGLPRPTPGTRICVLSDLGALAATPALEQRWLGWIRQWRGLGASVVAWCPSATGQVQAELAQHAEVRHLCGRSLGRLHPTSRGWRTPEQRADQHARLRAQAERLLTLASCALHVAPALLRELRLLDAELRHAPGAEALAWCAPEVGRSLLSRPLQAESAPRWRARFAQLPPALQQAVAACIQRMHAQRGRSTAWLEWLLWECHSAPAAHRGHETQIAAARQALRRLFHAGAGAALQHTLVAVAFDVQRMQHFDAKWWAAEGDWAGKLLALAEVASIPAGLSAAQILSAQPLTPARSCFLGQVGNALWLMPTQGPPACQRLTADFRSDLLLLKASQTSHEPLTKIATQHAPCRLAPLAALSLYTREQQFDLVEIPRPTVALKSTTGDRTWALEFGHDRHGVYALTPAFAGVQAKFHVLPPALAAAASPFLARDQRKRYIEFSAGKLQCRLGFDLNYGAFAEIRIGNAAQRMRWIEHGEFWMGSPDDEPERRSNEGPRHRVRISQGFWLADTACTQALWRAVMGKNPSRFKGDPQLPVEQLSWHDAQKFFQRLAALGLPGVDLPTEAQWEYACRAGTQTPFHFGWRINPGLVNYDGNHPFAGGAKSGWRKRTMSVKALPANDWGLFQMHGNVFEWCKDGQREYEKGDKAIPDPEGPQVDNRRALRGGSWLSTAGFARGAFRFAFPPADRSVFIGLRFVLRSMSPDVRVAAEPPRGATAERSS